MFSGIIEKLVRVHPAGAREVLVKFLGFLRGRNAEVPVVPDGHIHDEGFDQHLREHHVEFLNNIFDRGHVLPRGSARNRGRRYRRARRTWCRKWMISVS